MFEKLFKAIDINSLGSPFNALLAVLITVASIFWYKSDRKNLNQYIPYLIILAIVISFLIYGSDSQKNNIPPSSSFIEKKENEKTIPEVKMKNVKEFEIALNRCLIDKNQSCLNDLKSSFLAKNYVSFVNGSGEERIDLLGRILIEKPDIHQITIDDATHNDEGKINSMYIKY
jgi:hypothetical protein